MNNMSNALYVVIMMTEDGDSYNIHVDLDTAEKNFMEESEKDFYTQVYLLKTTPGTEFGFGSYGDVYGAEIIQETVDAE